jgi:hypothetical protein
LEKGVTDPFCRSHLSSHRSKGWPLRLSAAVYCCFASAGESAWERRVARRGPPW